MASSTKAPAQKRHSRISISSAVSKAVPQCVPYLMPFHIAYTGPAPVSTYFRVEDAKKHVGSPEAFKDVSSTEAPGSSTESPSYSHGVAQSLSSDQTDATSSSNGEQKPDDGGTSTSSVTLTPENQSRFVSAFRGRTVQGLKIEIPKGYTGIVFRSEDEAGMTGNVGIAGGKGTGKAARVAQQQGRATRGSVRPRAVEDEAMDIDAEEEEQDEQVSQSTLNLVPSSQFKSFVLWHPDIPVDTGRDEYISSIDEWMRIASVLHQVPPGIDA